MTIGFTPNLPPYAYTGRTKDLEQGRNPRIDLARFDTAHGASGYPRTGRQLPDADSAIDPRSPDENTRCRHSCKHICNAHYGCFSVPVYRVAAIHAVRQPMTA